MERRNITIAFFSFFLSLFPSFFIFYEPFTGSAVYYCSNSNTHEMLHTSSAASLSATSESLFFFCLSSSLSWMNIGMPPFLAPSPATSTQCKLTPTSELIVRILRNNSMQDLANSCDSLHYLHCMYFGTKMCTCIKHSHMYTACAHVHNMHTCTHSMHTHASHT